MPRACGTGCVSFGPGHFGARIEIAPSVDPAVADLLFDPQTSGGLLAAVAPAAAEGALAALRAAGVEASCVGTAVPPGESRIRVY